MMSSNITKDTEVRKTKEQKGCFSVIEYLKDFSVTPEFAAQEYFAAKMNIRKKQLLVTLKNDGPGVIVQPGAMQLTTGSVAVKIGVSGVTDFTKKVFSGKLTGEKAVKPEYRGEGILLLEPTYEHIFLTDLSSWGGKMVIENDLFLACENTATLSMTSRKNISSSIAGGEGLFNTMVEGSGVVALTSPMPNEELIVFDLKDDTLQIDGNLAIAWSDTLKFTVNKTEGSIAGSVVGGERLVNVYSGTGRVVVAPVF